MAFSISVGYPSLTRLITERYTCYLIEESLSLDNLFAFYLIFRYFKVPLECQNRVLQWGIFGAVLMRALMIGAGALIVQKFHQALVIFALVLVYQGGKIIFDRNDDDGDNDDLSDNQVIRLVQGLIPVTSDYTGDRFTVNVNGKTRFTPLVLVLISIELSDIVFAIDSVPAAFGISESPAVIYTANMFAILSLRSLYSLIAIAVNGATYLQKAIGVVLVFIGGKMLAAEAGFEMKTAHSLGIVAFVLSTGSILSLKGLSSCIGGEQPGMKTLDYKEV